VESGHSGTLISKEEDALFRIKPDFITFTTVMDAWARHAESLSHPQQTICAPPNALNIDCIHLKKTLHPAMLLPNSRHVRHSLKSMVVLSICRTSASVAG
jgi:hypothetical protein